MTTMQIDRAVVEQALEALEYEHRSPRGYGYELSVYEMRETSAAITVLRATLAQQADPETCTWHQDGDSDSGVYATSCRRYFNLEDGTPEDNKMQWCCYCGKKLTQELITENDDE